MFAPWQDESYEVNKYTSTTNEQANGRKCCFKKIISVTYSSYKNGKRHFLGRKRISKLFYARRSIL